MLSPQAHYAYTCINKDKDASVSLVDCSEHSTPLNDDGGGGDKIEYLDRHNVQCPEDKVSGILLLPDHVRCFSARDMCREAEGVAATRECKMGMVTK